MCACVGIGEESALEQMRECQTCCRCPRLNTTDTQG